MQLRVDRPTLVRSGYVGLSIAVSAVLFVIILEALNRFVKIREGMPAAAATFAMVFVGIAELAFVIFAGELFRRRKRIVQMSILFFRIIAALGLFFAAVQVFELWTFVPNPANWPRLVQAVWDASDYAYFIAGLIAGIGGTAFARVLTARPRTDTR